MSSGRIDALESKMGTIVELLHRLAQQPEGSRVCTIPGGDSTVRRTTSPGVMPTKLSDSSGVMPTKLSDSSGYGSPSYAFAAMLIASVCASLWDSLQVTSSPQS